MANYKVRAVLKFSTKGVDVTGPARAFNTNTKTLTSAATAACQTLRNHLENWDRTMHAGGPASMPEGYLWQYSDSFLNSLTVSELLTLLKTCEKALDDTQWLVQTMQFRVGRAGECCLVFEVKTRGILELMKGDI